VGNKVPESMVAGEERLELLSEATIRDAESRDWTEKQRGKIFPFINKSNDKNIATESKDLEMN
jgi:hypothetical protein